MKPILFNTEMVRAIQDGRKTATRRIIKPQPKSKLAYISAGHGYGKWHYPSEDAWKYWDDESFKHSENLAEEDLKQFWTPPVQHGDILYVRETWAINNITPHDPEWLYKADYNCSIAPYSNWKWKPSIHMPKEAARLFLRVTGVRVERLQDISDEDAEKEGCEDYTSTALGFPWVWDGTIPKKDLDRYGWNANPWVWVYELKRISKEDLR